MSIDFGCVVVGYDGSAAGTAALRWALEHASPDGHVLATAALGREPVPVPGAERIARVGTRMSHDDRHLWQAWEIDAEAVGDEAELVVERGLPSAVLLRIAAERGADLIVLGRHHHGRLGAVLPSVLRDVLHAAEVPVVVVP
ncbi:MAG: universal stress protein [Solirubrobacterales bacterium]|nr:universal stress protein [Solirubrobacterales bacterium]